MSKELPEIKQPIPIEKERELLKSLANSSEGAAMRQVLAKARDNVKDLDFVSQAILNGGIERLGQEILARKIAADFLEGIRSKIIPVEESKPKTTHK